MKKIYKNRLPKDKEVKNTNVRVENGEVVVEVELKDKFEPKDGDFVVLGYKTIAGSCYWISIIKDFSEKDGTIITKDYVNYTFKAEGNQEKYLNNINFDEKTTAAEGFRPATEKEKSDFLNRLKNECGKTWNSEKKCLEDIYIPKFGDIVRIEYPEAKSYKRNYVISIFPDKEVPKGSVNRFFDIATVNMDGNINIKHSLAAYNIDHVYIASPSEKKELFDKLAEVGKKWNEETKQLEDIRWKPKMGEIFYYINTGHNVVRSQFNLSTEYVVENNNCFKNEEAAQKVADKIKEIFKNSKAE